MSGPWRERRERVHQAICSGEDGDDRGGVTTIGRWLGGGETRIKQKLFQGKAERRRPTDCATQVVELRAVNLINYFWAMHSTLLVG